MYDDELERYISQLEKMSDDQRAKHRATIRSYLKSYELNAEDLARYECECKASDHSENYKATSDKVSRVQKFAKWLREQEATTTAEGQSTTTPQNDAEQTVDEASAKTPDEPSDEQQAPATSAPEALRGQATQEITFPSSSYRKCKSGEKRSKKVMAYLPPSLWAFIDDLCRVKKWSINDVIVQCLEQLATNPEYQKKVADFRAISG